MSAFRFVVALLLGVSLTACADSVSWTNLIGGTFSGPNWWDLDNPENTAPPTPADEAVFAIGNAPYMVICDGNTTASASVRNLSSPILDLSAGGYTIAGLLAINNGFLTASGGKLNVGRIDACCNSSPAPLTLTNGAFVQIGAPLGNSQGGVVALDVLDGSKLVVQGGAPRVNATVDGAGSLFDAGGDLSGIGLRVSNGALVKSDSSTNNAGNVAVFKSGSWQMPGLLAIGVPDAFGNSGILKIQSGGTVFSGSGVIAQNPAFENPLGQVTIGDPGSTWVIAGLLQVGLASSNQGNLLLENGGAMMTGSLDAGINPRSLGVITLRNGSAATNSGPFRIGVAGSGSLALTAGSKLRLTSPGPFAIGSQAGGQGTVSVIGTNSEISSSLGVIHAGEAGTGTLSVTDGGQVSAQSTLVGTVAGGVGAVSIIGNAASLRLARDLTIGAGGTGRVNVERGGQLTVGGETIHVGAGAGANGTLILNGPTSKFNFGGMLLLGEDGGRGTLILSNQFKLDATRQVVVGRSGGGLASVFVDGTNSSWQIDDQLVLGEGAPGELTVDRGASIRVGQSGVSDVTGPRDPVAASTLSKAQARAAGANIALTDLIESINDVPAKTVVSQGADAILSIRRGAKETESMRIGSVTGKSGLVAVSDGGRLTAGWILLNGATGPARLNVFGRDSLLEITGEAPLAPFGVSLDVQGPNAYVEVSAPVRIAKNVLLSLGGSISVHTADAAFECADLTIWHVSASEPRPSFLQVSDRGHVQIGHSPMSLAPQPARLFVDECIEVRVESGAGLDVGGPYLLPAGNGLFRLNSTGTLQNYGTIVASSWELHGRFVGNADFESPGVNSGVMGMRGGPRGPCRAQIAPSTLSSRSPAGQTPGSFFNLQNRSEIPFGTITVHGDFEQTSTGTLEVQFGGVTPDSEHGVLAVSGQVKLAGTLSLQFINGFAPRAGQSLEFLKFGTNIVGQFDRIEILGLAPGFQYSLKPSTLNVLSLTALNDGVAISQPLISAKYDGNQLSLSWPEAAQGFRLQSTTNLLSPNWQDRLATDNRLTTPVVHTQEFFRLVQ